ncbi:hypothetical protein VRU48_03265 [Pedobacter sp. KR3-3]|uniref:Outer membrane protein beta-barrel domain-containing protein n=1 Tax=Pedobacter albus TaxID=3113905 RepID=A0ABU7I3S2_9SPHI|nr:hypothetical protein [Pedobacter sp. KR3-3]MEE1944112.1 hypothetical protein [Pedobacter sp. KR3-3]
MNRILLCLAMLQGSVVGSLAQAHLGARLTAMGNNGNTVEDVWSIQGNPAGISGISAVTAAIDYTKYLFATELSRQAMAIAIPFQKNSIGIGLDRYGIAEYSEIKASLAVVKQFGGQLGIGLKGNYHQLKINNYGATTAFSLGVGFLYRLNKWFLLGFYADNPALQKYKSPAVKLTIPTSFHLGLSYFISDKVLLATDLSKTLQLPIDVAIGIDYELLSLLSLRGGLTAKPFKQYAGFGLHYRKLMLDMAVASDPYLGYSPQITLAYVF